MVGLSPRVNHAESGTRVITIFDQAISLVKERCPDVVCIISCGKGLFLVYREDEGQDYSDRLAPLIRETGRAQSCDGVLRLHVKKVRNDISSHLPAIYHFGHPKRCLSLSCAYRI